jgi:predicted  nucleic acid-binding Zn-ribbon protein
MINPEEKLKQENEKLQKEIKQLRKTVVMQEMERNDLFKRFAKVEAELEDYRIQEFNATMFKK